MVLLQHLYALNLAEAHRTSKRYEAHAITREKNLTSQPKRALILPYTSQEWGGFLTPAASAVIPPGSVRDVALGRWLTRQTACDDVLRVPRWEHHNLESTVGHDTAKYHCRIGALHCVHLA